MYKLNLPQSAEDHGYERRESRLIQKAIPATHNAEAVRVA